MMFFRKTSYITIRELISLNCQSRPNSLLYIVVFVWRNSAVLKDHIFDCPFVPVWFAKQFCCTNEIPFRRFKAWISVLDAHLHAKTTTNQCSAPWEWSRVIREKNKPTDVEAWRLSSNTPTESDFSLESPRFQVGTVTDSTFEPCQVLLRPSKEDFTIGLYTVVCFPLIICSLIVWLLKLHVSLSSGWDKIFCEIQTILITRLIKFRTFGPSCKIKSMAVAAFHNLFTSWVCDAIKMLHIQVILLAFTFMLWLTG